MYKYTLSVWVRDKTPQLSSFGTFSLKERYIEQHLLSLGQIFMQETARTILFFFHRSEAILKAGGFVSAFCCARPAVLFQTARWLESANMLQQIAGVRKSNMLLKCMCIRDAEFESEFAPNLIHKGQVLRNQTVEIWNLRSEKERNWIEEVMVWPSPAYFRLRKLSKKERKDFKNAECRSDQITKISFSQAYHPHKKISGESSAHLVFSVCSAGLPSQIGTCFAEVDDLPKVNASSQAKPERSEQVKANQLWQIHQWWWWGWQLKT